MGSDLKEFAITMTKQAGEVSFGKSYAGKALKGVRKIFSRTAKGAKKVAKDVKTTPAERKKIRIAFKDSLAGKAILGSGRAAKETASLAGKIGKYAVTTAGKDGKRKLSPIKALMIAAPGYGAYSGMKKGQMKAKAQKYYGQRKPDEVYFDPRRRLR